MDTETTARHTSRLKYHLFCILVVIELFNHRRQSLCVPVFALSKTSSVVLNCIFMCTVYLNLIKWDNGRLTMEWWSPYSQFSMHILILSGIMDTMTAYKISAQNQNASSASFFYFFTIFKIITSEVTPKRSLSKKLTAKIPFHRKSWPIVFLLLFKKNSSSI